MANADGIWDSELGLATHFVPSESIPKLLDRLALLLPVDESSVNSAINEFTVPDYSEPSTSLVGAKRQTLDRVFGKKTVEEIVGELQGVKEEGGEVGEWAQGLLQELELRSPTALKVALEAQLQGAEGITLAEALQLELRFATAFCSGASPDFVTGVKAVLEEKLKGRPAWSPPTLGEVSRDYIYSNFISPNSPYTSQAPPLEFAPSLPSPRDPMQYCLPTEAEIGLVVRGEHKDSGAMAMTTAEVAGWFVDKVDKPGVVLKVLDVLSRKTREKRDGYLQWLH